jgi:adenylate kinase family enzyme
MQRVVILGCSGAGKSTLALKMGARLGLPVVHLDTLFYEPGWKPGNAQAFRDRTSQALAGEAWIVDGNFLSDVGEISLPRADAIVWIDQPRWLCLARAFWRSLESFGRRRPDLPDGCLDRPDRATLAYIWTYDRRFRPAISGWLGRLAPDTPVHHLNGDREIAAFVAGL